MAESDAKPDLHDQVNQATTSEPAEAPSIPEVDVAPEDLSSSQDASAPADDDTPVVSRYAHKAVDAATIGAGAAQRTVMDGYSAMREVHRAAKEHGAARTHLQEIQDEIDDAQAELDHRVEVEQNYDTIIAEQTQALDEAIAARNDVEAEIDTLSGEHDDLANQLEEMKETHERELKPYHDLMESSRQKADDASKALSEARRALKAAEGQVSDATSRREARAASANRSIDNAKARLVELQSRQAELKADPASEQAALDEVAAAIESENEHLTGAQEEASAIAQEMQRTMDNAQAHLWTQKQSVEGAERAHEAAAAEARERKEEYDKKRLDAQTEEATLDNAVVERELKIREANKSLDAAKVQIDKIQAVIDDANQIHATPEATESLRHFIQDNKAALAVQQRQVAELAKNEQNLREQTRQQRYIFMGIIAVAALIVILILIKIIGG